MAVGNIVQRAPRRGTRYFSGEFTGAAGSISGVKTKGEFSVTYSGVGLYTIQYLENGVAAKPGSPCRIAQFQLNAVGLSTVGQGGWDTNITTDNLNTNGSFTITAFSVAGAAADIQVLAKVWFTVELEAA